MRLKDITRDGENTMELGGNWYKISRSADGYYNVLTYSHSAGEWLDMSAPCCFPDALTLCKTDAHKQYNAHSALVRRVDLAWARRTQLFGYGTERILR